MTLAPLFDEHSLFLFLFQQRAPLVRIYSMLGLLGILSVMTAEMIRIVVHFKFKVTAVDNIPGWEKLTIIGLA